MVTRSKLGFTLLELLVVISLIALLMAILSPALATARSRARSAVCKSNIRQLVIANIGYATESDGFYVPAASDMWDSFGGYHRWHGTRDHPDRPFNPLKGPLIAYLRNGLVKECPEKVKFIKGHSWNENFEQGCGGYGYNMLYIGSRLWRVGITTLQDWRNAYSRTTRASEVAKPSGTLMFADCAMSNSQGRYIEYSFAEPPFTIYNGKPVTSFYMSPSIHFRHRQRANIAWSDGHIDMRSMVSFEVENAYLVKSSEMMLGWFKPVDNSMFDLR